MLLSLLPKEDKCYFIELLRQFFLVDGESSEVEKQIHKKFKLEIGEDYKKLHLSNVNKDKIIEYFKTRPNTTLNIVYMNLFVASLEDEWYNVEVHQLLDDIQSQFGITDKKRIELMKIVYAERDLREKAKRVVNE